MFTFIRARVCYVARLKAAMILQQYAISNKVIIIIIYIFKDCLLLIIINKRQFLNVRKESGANGKIKKAKKKVSERYSDKKWRIVD